MADMFYECFHSGLDSEENVVFSRALERST